MNPFFRLLFGVMGGGVLALGRFTIALANGEDVHIDTLMIPVAAVWIGGGVLAAFFLFFFIGWGLSYRTRSGSQEWEPEKKAKEEKR